MILFISIIILLLTIFRFGLPFNIVYETCDSGTHFWSAKDFFEQSYLLNNVTDKTIVDFKVKPFASYVNLGIIFKMFSSVMDVVDFYKLYIVFDILMLLLTTLMFYVLISSNKKINVIVLVVGTLLYMFGYPLNSLIIGFFYLGHAIMIITLMFILFRMYIKNDINKFIILSLLMLTSLGLFFTFYFFVPVVFGGLFLYFLYNIINNKGNIFKFKNLMFIFLIFILPCIVGILYFVIPNIGDNTQSIFTHISLDGYCYIDLYNSTLMFLPFITYYIGYSIKKKKLNFEIFIYIILWLFMIILFIGWNYNLVSTYYLSKSYYLMWLVNFMLLFRLLEEIRFDKIIFLISCIIFIIIFSILKFSNVQNNFDSITPDHIIINDFMSGGIYGYNIEKLENPTVVLTNSEMKDIKRLYNSGVRNINSNAMPYARVWLTAYFETNKIDYPENKLYDYIVNHYYISMFQKNLHDAIFFDRFSIIDNFNYQDLCNDCIIKKYDSFLYVSES